MTHYHHQPCAPYLLVIDMDVGVAQVVTRQQDACHRNNKNETTCENDKQIILSGDDDNNDDITKMYAILCCFVVTKCLLCY